MSKNLMEKSPKQQLRELGFGPLRLMKSVEDFILKIVCQMPSLFLKVKNKKLKRF
jgi:hypothetical protein